MIHVTLALPPDLCLATFFFLTTNKFVLQCAPCITTFSSCGSGEFHRARDIYGTTAGRKRGLSLAAEYTDRGENGSENPVPEKRPRRQSSRRILASEAELWGDSDIPRGSGKSRSAVWKMPRKSYDQTKIGPNHQVDTLPSKPTMEGITVDGRLIPTEPVAIQSKLVFSRRYGGAALDRFLHTMRSEIMGRDGVPLSPWNEERAIGAWMGARGHHDFARRMALGRIPRRPTYPGTRAGTYRIPWSRDEEMTFAAYIGQEFDSLEVMFRQMSRSVLKSRSVQELVLHWYTGYKPMGRDASGPRAGYMVDNGVEASPPSSLQPEAITSFLRSIAVSAGDGFPPERRMRNIIFDYRAKLQMKMARKRARRATLQREEQAMRCFD